MSTEEPTPAAQNPEHRERLSCRLGWHEWTKWEHHEDADLKSLFHGDQKVEIQKRECRHCGKGQRHVVKCDL